jgi:hypothetical protein
VSSLRRNLERGVACIGPDADAALRRALSWTLAAGAANDFLQAGFAALCAKTNEGEDEAS